MNPRLVLFSTACLSCFFTPAAGASLSAGLAASAGVDGSVLGSPLGAALSGNGSLVIQTQPGTVAVEAPPQNADQQMNVLQPVEYKPVQTVSLIPIATYPSYSMTDKLSSLWGGISNVISSKTRAVGEFLRALRGPPRIVLIKVNAPSTTTTTTTTTTTKKPTNKPLVIELLADAHHRYYPLQVPMSDDCDKK